jgi:hypothetical protein
MPMIIFFIYASFEVFTAGCPTVALLCDMILHKWTIGYRSFQVTQCPYRPGGPKFPTGDVLRHFAYWRQGKDASSICRDPVTQRCSITTQKNEILLYPYSYKWAREVLSIPIRQVLCILTNSTEWKKLLCVGSGRKWVAFTKVTGTAASTKDLQLIRNKARLSNTRYSCSS